MDHHRRGSDRSRTKEAKGIFHLQVKLEQMVEKHELLGFITDTLGDTNIKVRSPQAGIVIGHTQNPLVNQGDGIINLAIKPL